MRRIRRRRMVTLKPFGHVGADALRVSLGDLSASVADRLAYHFHGVDAVEVIQGNLLDLSCDAIVSPANGFGDMGGGIDKAIDDFHGGAAQRAVMAAIREHWYGELPVGAALIVKVSARRWPYVVAAPTMRIPGNVARTINAYLAMRAALVAVLKQNSSEPARIRSMAIPGLCTGVGGMRYEDASEQMRAAYDNVIGGQWQQVAHLAMAPYAL